MPLDLTALESRVRHRASQWDSLGLVWAVSPIRSNYGTATASATFEGVELVGQTRVWVTGETELETLRTTDGRIVNKHYELESAADLDGLLDELVALIRDDAVPPNAVTAQEDCRAPRVLDHPMDVPASPSPPASDEHVIRTFGLISVSFCGGLVLILAVTVLFLVPNGSVRGRGLLIGVALGLVSWFGSRWIPSRAMSRAARPGRKVTLAGAIGAAAFSGIFAAEAPALVGLALTVADGEDIGPLVAIPVAIVAIVVNASGPRAMRRHLAQLRA